MADKDTDSSVRPDDWEASCQLERRYLSRKPELREIENEKGEKTTTLVGYAAVFGKPSEVLARTSSGMELVEYMDESMFDEVLASNPDVRCLFNHKDDYVLGRTKNGTLRIERDATGLRYEVDLPDTPLVRDMVLEPIKRGDIDQSSCGFVLKSDDWKKSESGNVVRTLTNVYKLKDVSPVTIPAYPDTTVAMRSYEQWTSGDISDEGVAKGENTEYDSAKDGELETLKRDKVDLERENKSLKEQRDAALARAKVLLGRFNQIIKED